MSKVLQIAVREFVATVCTKAFVIGLLIFPAMIAIGVVVGPRLFSDRDFSVEGELAIVDPTGRVASGLEAALARDATADGTTAADSTQQLILDALGARPELTLVERPPDADVEQEKRWLVPRPDDAADHLALVVVHEDAVEPRPGGAGYGSYDLYVPPNQDIRVEQAVKQALRQAIVSARVGLSGLDRERVDALVTVPNVRSVTVTEDEERGTVPVFNMLVPFAFMFLLFMGVLGSGQGLLTTTIEEKSSRVVEVLLSAVSPMQLMAGKLLGHMAISLLAMSLYIGVGLAGLASFSLFGLLDPLLIAYLLVFFLLTFLMVGTLMMAAGAAVNDISEAQSFMMPITLIMIVPWFLWMPISRDPNSTLAVVVSFLPPINTFGMLLRVASSSPPPVWQVLLSMAIAAVAVVGALWFAGKVFRIGLLMFGKAPNFATLVRWVRAA